MIGQPNVALKFSVANNTIMKNKKLVTAIIALLITNVLVAQSLKKEVLPPLSADSFAADIHRQAQPQIIDARKPEEFALNHINGAINIDQFAGNYAEQLKLFDKKRPVFIYAIQNYRPGILAKELRELGFPEVYELKSGIANWIGSGYPYFNGVKNWVSLAEYNKKIGANRLVLVDIGTKYCGTCVKVKHLIDSLQPEPGNGYVIEQIDLYQNPDLVAGLKKEVQAVPTVLLYKDGKIIWKRTGLSFTKSELVAALENAR